MVQVVASQAQSVRVDEQLVVVVLIERVDLFTPLHRTRFPRQQLHLNAEEL